MASSLQTGSHALTKSICGRSKVAAGGGEQIVAWTFERPDGGRSFGTTLSHFHEVWRGESFWRLIVNAILQAAKLEVPEARAPVALGEEALALPPDPREKPS